MSSTDVGEVFPFAHWPHCQNILLDVQWSDCLLILFIKNQWTVQALCNLCCRFMVRATAQVVTVSAIKKLVKSATDFSVRQLTACLCQELHQSKSDVATKRFRYSDTIRQRGHVVRHTLVQITSMNSHHKQSCHCEKNKNGLNQSKHAVTILIRVGIKSVLLVKSFGLHWKGK